jgi:formylglycine-generating enzyme required for sulfatase activity
MIGNVSEWCQLLDETDYTYVPDPWSPPQPAPDGPGLYAAVRGACYLRSHPGRMASWHRRRLSKTRRNAWVGFRTASYLGCRPAV